MGVHGSDGEDIGIGARFEVSAAKKNSEENGGGQSSPLEDAEEGGSCGRARG